VNSFDSQKPALTRTIHDRLASIISKWLQRLKAEVTATRGLSDEFLTDHMPVFLRSLAESFSTPDDLINLRTARENAKTHGAQRTRSKYTVSQVVSDYIFLREVLIHEISTGYQLTKQEILSVSRFFEAAIGAAVEEFTLTNQRQSANEDLKAIADAVLTLIIRTDLEFRYVFVNRAYEEWTGRPAAEVLGKTVHEVIDGEAFPRIFEFMSRAAEGERITYEHQAKRGDGALEHMLFTFVPARDVRGKITGIVITVQSIEQQKRAEFDAQQRRHELSNVFAQAPTPIALFTGPEHIFTLANPPYIELIGRNPIGRKVRTVFSEAEAGNFFALLDQVYQTGVPYFGNELPFNRRMVEGIEIESKQNIAYHPYRSPSGEIAGILTFVYDVTDQVRARKLIEDSELRLQSIFAHASVGFAVSDLAGHFLEANPRFSEITGYSVDELKKMAVIDIVHTADLQMDRAKLSELTSGRVDSFVIEKRFVKKNGDIAWVRNSVSLLPTPGQEPLIIRVAEDVTVVREAERLRRESEEKYQLLADSMPQIVWTAEPDGGLDYFNKGWYDYSGTNFEQNVGSGWAAAVHPDDIELAVQRWTSSLRTGARYETEFRLRASDGTYRWFVARATAARDRNGKVKKWYGTNTDIHEFKSVTEALQKAQQNVADERRKFRALVADATTPMAVLSGPDLVFEIANQSYLGLFDGRNMVGKSLLEALPELEGQEFPKLLRAAYEKGEIYQESEALAKLRRTADGELEDRYFDQSYKQMLDENGDPSGVFIQAIDVTEKVLSRRKLEEIAERLRIAVEAANMGTWDLNPQTGLIDWSDRTRELFGVPRVGSVPLSAALEMIHPEDKDRVAKAIEAAIDPYGNRSYDIEYRIGDSDANSRWVSLLGRSFYVETPTGRVSTRFSGTVLDVTDRVLADVALRDAKERAELANATKSSFLANMSHEIRTPLGAIMGFVSLIKDEGASAQTTNNYISVIERNSVQLMRIIDDILDLSKVEAGMMLVEHIDFSLVELLSDFSSLMGFRAREKGIIFELKAQTELPDIVNSDPTRIRQILTNIVGNAIKFTDQGSVSLRVSFVDGFLSFDVEDTGRGISPDQSVKLFQPFAQGDPSTTRKYGGTGLGLVLTRRLSEALGCTFEIVTSELGVGSRFAAKIAVRLAEKSRFVRALGFASEPIRNAGVQGLLRNVRILLVEDSPDNQALFSIYLNRAGAKIDIASDGQRGVEMALADSYDVVLMDVQMPIMDGITAVKTLRSSGYEKPIIALTAHAMKEEKVRCLEAGYTGFLSKPIQRAELVDALVKFRRDN
jgi:PAS domain S-box-containing protein